MKMLPQLLIPASQINFEPLCASPMCSVANIWDPDHSNMLKLATGDWEEPEKLIMHMQYHTNLLFSEASDVK